MPFENKDRDALEVARQRGFTHSRPDASAYGWYEAIYKIEFGPKIAQGFKASEITEYLEALVRFTGSAQTTIWIDITTDLIHDSLVDAIEGSWYFMPSLYVSFKNLASHAPALPLPPKLQSAIEKVTSNRTMWHPVANIPVRANPCAHAD